MTRLIRLDDLMKFPIRIDHYDKEHGNEHFVYGVETVLEYAESLPTIEARPVVHGRNTYDHDSAFECSVCGFSDWDTMTADIPKYNYCPNCGADMRGADNG